MKMYATCFLILALILAVSAASAAEASTPTQLRLVQRGHPGATMILAQTPTRAAQLAAAELQYHIEKRLLQNPLDLTGGGIIAE